MSDKERAEFLCVTTVECISAPMGIGGKSRETSEKKAFKASATG